MLTVMTAAGEVLDDWARMHKLQRKKRPVRGLETDEELRRRILQVLWTASEKAALDLFNQRRKYAL